MRLLRVEIRGVEHFKDDGFTVDLFATDRVPKPDGKLATVDATLVGDAGSIYSLNTIGMTGLNASGKTTLLNLLHVVLDMLSGEAAMQGSRPQNLTLGKVGPRLDVSVTFWHDGSFYLLESTLVRQGQSAFTDQSLLFGFRFADETVWRLSTRRPNRAMIASVDLFKKHAVVVRRRMGEAGDNTVLTGSEPRLLGGGRSIIADIVGSTVPFVTSLERELPVERLDAPVAQVFDPRVVRLEWDEENAAYTLQFKGEPARIVTRSVAVTLLSRGTVLGAEMVACSTEVLARGGYLLVDGIEETINRPLVKVIIQLFASPVTNPRGAQLVFTTHCPELLDVLNRKDDVYLLVRGGDQKIEVVKYCDRVPRMRNKKSEVILSGFVRGTVPCYTDVQAIRDYARAFVEGRA